MPRAADWWRRAIPGRCPRHSPSYPLIQTSVRRWARRRGVVSKRTSRWTEWSRSIATSTRGSPEMCGIAGMFSLRDQLPPSARRSVEAMNAAMAHRGPDGDGFYEQPRVILGHRRLAIIDRAGGRQPMSNEDGSCWIVFNGEVYNHRALRPLLESKGHVFRTSSDTETILHAYEEFGPACLDRLEGMFAFAIFDGRKRQLFAA